MQQDYISTTEAAKISGLNRTQIFRLIKSGCLPAMRVGRNYIIKKENLGIFTDEISVGGRRRIEGSVDEVFKQYGDVIKRLGEE